MNVLIVGAGTQGKFIAQTLSNDSNNVTVVDYDPRAKELLSFASNESNSINVVIGDGCEYATLEKANCNTADVVLACSGDDEDNLVISLLAKQEFGVSRVLARVNHPHNEWLFNDHWGVDKAVSGSHILTSLIEEEITSDLMIGLLKFEDGKVELVEIKLSASSKLIGKQYSEIELPRECSTVAILRDSHVMFSYSSVVLSVGDEIILLAHNEVIKDVKELLEN